MNFSILIAAVMLSTSSLGAHADTSTPDPIIRGRSVVHFSDLNINSEQDAKILLQRIEIAAEQACGGRPALDAYTGAPDRDFAECRRGTIARAVKKLGARQVTRIYFEANRDDHGPRLR